MERIPFAVAIAYLLMAVITISRLLNHPGDGSRDAMREALDQQLLLSTAVVFGGLSLLAGIALRWQGESALGPERKRWVQRLVWLLMLPGVWMLLTQ